MNNTRIVEILCECYKSFGSSKTRKLVYKVSSQENIVVILKNSRRVNSVAQRCEGKMSMNKCLN